MTAQPAQRPSDDDLCSALLDALPDWMESGDMDEVTERLVPVVRRFERAGRDRGFDLGNEHGRRMAQSVIVVKLEDLAAQLDESGLRASINPGPHSGLADGFVNAAETVRNAIAGMGGR